MTPIEVAAGQSERAGVYIEAKGRERIVLGVDEWIGPIGTEEHVTVRCLVGLGATACRGAGRGVVANRRTLMPACSHCRLGLHTEGGNSNHRIWLEGGDLAARILAFRLRDFARQN